MNSFVKRLKSAASPAFELLYLSCVFFMYFEIAVPLPISVFKGLYVGVFIVLALRVALLREGTGLLLPSPLRSPRVLLPLFLLLGYLFLDLAGLLYSPVTDFAASKYLVIAPMLLFLIPTLCYARDEAHLDRLYRTLALSGLAVGLFSLSNYFVYEFIPLPYIRRLSLIADYNRYAENLFITLVLGSYYIINTKLKRRERTLLLLFHITFFAAVVTLSGSRRTYLLLFPALAALLLYRSFYIVRYSASERAAFRRLVLGGVLTACAVLAVFTAQAGFERYSDIKYRQELENGGGIPTENSVDTVIDSIATGGMFDKRAVIWQVALETALNYDFPDIIIGRGSGYDAHLYDISADSRLAELYASVEEKPKNWMSPHNFLLADFLSGGLARLCVSLALLGVVMIRLAQLFMRRPHRALGLCTVMALVYFNAFISGRYGFAYDKFYYILLACIVVEGTLAEHARASMER